MSGVRIAQKKRTPISLYRRIQITEKALVACGTVTSVGYILLGIALFHVMFGWFAFSDVFAYALIIANTLGIVAMLFAIPLTVYLMLNQVVFETVKIPLRVTPPYVQPLKKEAKRTPRHKRRSQRMSQARLLGTHTNDEWTALLREYNYSCAKCGRRAPDVTISKDHIVPVSVGGSDDIDNIQPLCTRCNSSKSTRIIDYRKGVAL